MDYTLLLTVVIIFVSTLVGSFLRGRARDRCITDFDGFLVTLVTTAKKYVWGVMRLEASGFELHYDSDYVDKQQSHIETSYILYKAEYVNLQSLHLNIDRLTESHRQERDRSAKRAFHPKAWAHVGRSLRNFVNSAASSLNEITALLVGRSKLVTSQAVMAQGQTHLVGMTKEVIGYVGTTYDPLLEQLIGIRVVFEVSEEGVWHEYVGILKEYSADFLLLLDVHHLEILDLALHPPKNSAGWETQPTVALDRAEAVRATFDGQHILVENLRERPLVIRTIVCDTTEHPICALVRPNDTWEYTADQQTTHWNIQVEVVRHCDVIIPRTHAIVRHRAERYDHAQVLQLALHQQPEPEGPRDQPLLQPDDICDCDHVLAHWLYLAEYDSEEVANAQLRTVDKAS